MTPARQMLERVGDLTRERDVSPDQFLDGALALLVAAIGKLPLEQQEDALVDLEDGEMRRRVTRFCAALELKRRLQ